MSWPLQPKIVRELKNRGLPADEKAVRSAEMKIVAEARRWPASEFAGSLSDQMILSLLQHHGVPTGFLDLTTDPMTALWFACESESDPATAQRKGVLLAFDVTDWPVLATEIPGDESKWSHHADPLGYNYHHLHVGRNKTFLVEPTRPSGRLMSQRGKLFRAQVLSENDGPFGIQLDGIPAHAGEIRPSAILKAEKGTGRPATLPFVAILIGTQQKVTLLSHLEGTNGLKRSILFPDVSGFAAAVNQRVIPISQIS